MSQAQSDGRRVLVKEKIADSGVDLLREHFDVEVGLEMSAEELDERIGEFDALLVRSATKVTADLIGRADRLKVIGRAGTGVDNVDIPAATKRGIVVANAPESNSVAAAEHTVALMLALCRNVPQAHASLTAGKWERSKFGGTELYGKTLGVLGFGRIGQLVARRALSFDMNVIAFDKFVSPERFRELGVEGAESSEELYGRADFITVHLPKTPETINWLDAEAFAQMKDGVRIVNCARGELIDLGDLEAALDSGPVAGAALDVFPEEPMTEHPLFGREDVIVTPHLGASTAEAQDRAGMVTAEQVTAALTGGVVTNAVNIPAVRPEVMEVLAPYIPLAENLGHLAEELCSRPFDQIEVEFRGRIAELDTRLLGIAVMVGILQGHTEEQVNLVNAPALAEERGLEVLESKDPASEDFTDVITVRLRAEDEEVEVSGTTVGPKETPYLVRVWGQGFYLPFAEHFAILRYRDQPGMIGRVGTLFGKHGVNIGSAAVGESPGGDEAVMAVTTESPVPDDLLRELLADDAFFDGRSVNL